jgi:hypothetical protein
MEVRMKAMNLKVGNPDRTGQSSEENAVADRPKLRVEEIESQATVLSEAYRLRLIGRLWWANLAFVVLPAVLAAAAAVLAAHSEATRLIAAGCAGSAAVLSAIHKSLKCEEYQAECLRLSPAFKGIAIRAGSAVFSDVDGESTLSNLTKEYAELAGSAKAMLPDSYVLRAERLTGCTLR